MYLVTSEQMRYFDHYTIETRKVPAIVLMDHAGKAVADMALELGAKTVCVACGKGNNGGDGWVAARWLRHYGCDVKVFTAVDPDAALTGDARLAFAMATAAEVPWQVFTPGDLQAASFDFVIDALLGTGCTRPLTGVYEKMVEEINQLGLPVLAVDVPSGVDASTGEVHGVAVAADRTVAMAYEKVGTAVTPGAVCAGQVHVVDIGISAPLPEAMTEYVNPAQLRKRWGRREDLSHKGTYGRCGICVGEMEGAALLAAAGAARAGAGLVVLAAAGHRALATALPDYVIRRGADPLNALGDCQAIVIGPGLGAEASAQVDTFASRGGFAAKRGVIDADALSALAELQRLPGIGAGWVLTPHPKECAKLLGWNTADVQAKRLMAAHELAAMTGATVLLKGYRTVIATSAGQVRINPTGDASLAVGGSGDILSGVIGSLLAQGLDGFDAASLGAWLHGRAGELAGAALTKVSTTASDIVNYISSAMMTFFDS